MHSRKEIKKKKKTSEFLNSCSFCPYAKITVPPVALFLRLKSEVIKRKVDGIKYAEVFVLSTSRTNSGQVPVVLQN